eukprot:SAG22_NODE_207_length_15278_cov_4.056855_11_plen_84_part_00
MQFYDWIALVLSLFVVATAVVADLRDIELCAIAVDRAQPPVPKMWKMLLKIQGLIQRYVFLPTLVMTVAILVTFGGGDMSPQC